jgi:YHS domain-containing protein
VPCPDVFVQDVPNFARSAGLAFEDFFDARRPAVIDAEHCVRLNYEAFFFADLWERERFRSDPLVYCGLLTDPVSRTRFRPNASSPRATHEGVTYFFENERNRELFEDDAEKLRLPGWKM